MSFPSIHDAYGGFGEKSTNQINPNLPPSSHQELSQTPPNPTQPSKDNGKYPSDASTSNYPIKIKCPKCNDVCMTRMNS